MGQLISQFQEEATERVFGDYAYEEEGFFHPRHHDWLPEQTKEAKRNYEDWDNFYIMIKLLIYFLSLLMRFLITS